MSIQSIPISISALKEPLKGDPRTFLGKDRLNSKPGKLGIDHPWKFPNMSLGFRDPFKGNHRLPFKGARSDIRQV